MRTRLTLASVVLMISSCSGRHAPLQPLTPASPDYDRRVLEVLLLHHRVEAQVIATCMAKAARPELQEFCRELDAVQTAQADQMRQFLKRWFGADVPNTPVPISTLTREYQHFLRQIESEQGPAFDEAFLRGMRVHHRQGIREVEACESRAAREPLRNLCRDLNAAQQQDSAKLTDWICRWFRDCIGS